MSTLADSVKRLAPAALSGRVPLVAIVGAPRSGSTLLIRILDSHSRIAAPCEIGIPGVFPREDEKHSVVVEKWGQICAYYGVDPQRSERYPFVLFREILKKERKQVLVLKDPRASLYIRNLERYLPRYVHLIRDARSVASSRMFAEPGIGLTKWFAYHQSVLSFFAEHPRLAPVRVRYEDIVAKPEYEVRTLLSALGLSFEAGMLNFGDFEHADDRLRLWGDRPPVDSALQHDLGLSIRPEQAAPIWPKVILAQYDHRQDVRDLNQAFGYE